ncbi:hypothetical protein HK096_005474, partial [Nowakowskiella sp. JEL0078]
MLSKRDAQSYEEKQAMMRQKLEEYKKAKEEQKRLAQLKKTSLPNFVVSKIEQPKPVLGSILLEDKEATQTANKSRKPYVPTYRKTSTSSSTSEVRNQVSSIRKLNSSVNSTFERPKSREIRPLKNSISAGNLSQRTKENSELKRETSVSSSEIRPGIRRPVSTTNLTTKTRPVSVSSFSNISNTAIRSKSTLERKTSNPSKTLRKVASLETSKSLRTNSLASITLAPPSSSVSSEINDSAISSDSRVYVSAETLKHSTFSEASWFNVQGQGHEDTEEYESELIKLESEIETITYDDSVILESQSESKDYEFQNSLLAEKVDRNIMVILPEETLVNSKPLKTDNLLFIPIPELNPTPSLYPAPTVVEELLSTTISPELNTEDSLYPSPVRNSQEILPSKSEIACKETSFVPSLSIESPELSKQETAKNIIENVFETLDAQSNELDTVEEINVNSQFEDSQETAVFEEREFVSENFEITNDEKDIGTFESTEEYTFRSNEEEIDDQEEEFAEYRTNNEMQVDEIEYENQNQDQITDKICEFATPAASIPNIPLNFNPHFSTPEILGIGTGATRVRVKGTPHPNRGVTQVTSMLGKMMLRQTSVEDENEDKPMEDQSIDEYQSDNSETNDKKKKGVRFTSSEEIALHSVVAEVDGSRVTMLTPVRASKKERAEFGVSEVVTPVRRSTRLFESATQSQVTENEDMQVDEDTVGIKAALTATPAGEKIERLLKECDYAFVPNA